MSTYISTNAAALVAQNRLGQAEREFAHSVEKVASGRRIVRASDDAAGNAIAARIGAELGSTSQARRNALDALSVIQTAESGMNGINNLVQRLRELATQGASDTFGEDEKQFIEKEGQEIVAEIERMSQSVKYLSVPLLNGSGQDLTFFVGTANSEHSRIEFSPSETDLRPAALGLSGISFADSDSSRSALDRIDSALTRVHEAWSKLGGMSFRLETADNFLAEQETVLETARGHRLDADYGKELTEMTQSKIRMQAAAAVLAQANQMPALALKLLD